MTSVDAGRARAHSFCQSGKFLDSLSFSLKRDESSGNLPVGGGAIQQPIKKPRGVGPRKMFVAHEARQKGRLIIYHDNTGDRLDAGLVRLCGRGRTSPPSKRER